MLLSLNDSTTNELILSAKDKNLVLVDLKLEFIGGGRSLSFEYNVFISLAFTNWRGLHGIFASWHKDWEEGLRVEGIEIKKLRKENFWIEKKFFLLSSTLETLHLLYLVSHH